MKNLNNVVFFASTMVRLPISVLDTSKSMLLQSTRNSVASAVEKEAGWVLLSSLLASMPKQVM